MFSGSHEITMDAKGRVAIPAKVRESLVSGENGGLVVTASHLDRCLMLFPQDNWEQTQTRIEALPSLNKHTRRLKRLMIGYATPMQVDGNGRILLPPPLRTYAGLEKKLMLVGQLGYLELWNEDRWIQEAVSDFDADDGDLPEGMVDLF